MVLVVGNFQDDLGMAILSLRAENEGLRQTLHSLSLKCSSMQADLDVMFPLQTSLRADNDVLREKNLFLCNQNDLLQKKNILLEEDNKNLKTNLENSLRQACHS
jgi:hypothetical protein